MKNKMNQFRLSSVNFVYNILIATSASVTLAVTASAQSALKSTSTTLTPFNFTTPPQAVPTSTAIPPLAPPKIDPKLHHPPYSVVGHQTNDSVTHSSRISANHTTILSFAGHSPEQSFNGAHQPIDSEAHLEEISMGGHDPHLTSRDGQHFEFSSGQHLPIDSNLHTVEISQAGHNPSSSRSHLGPESRVHIAEITRTGHNPALSGSHPPQVSQRHATAASDHGHEVRASVRHVPDQSSLHSQAISVAGHSYKKSAAHRSVISRTHTESISQSGPTGGHDGILSLDDEPAHKPDVSAFHSAERSTMGHAFIVSDQHSTDQSNGHTTTLSTQGHHPGASASHAEHNSFQE